MYGFALDVCYPQMANIKKKNLQQVMSLKCVIKLSNDSTASNCRLFYKKDIREKIPCTEASYSLVVGGGRFVFMILMCCLYTLKTCPHPPSTLNPCLFHCSILSSTNNFTCTLSKKSSKMLTIGMKFFISSVQAVTCSSKSIAFPYVQRTYLTILLYILLQCHKINSHSS